MLLKQREPLSSQRQRIAVMAITTVLYVVTAQLGLLLAMQDCMVTALWPPAGIALASLLMFGRNFWPGVWVGAFVANLWPLLSKNSSVEITAAVFAASIIACSATAAAWFAAWGIRARSEIKNSPSGVRGVAIFMLYGGVLSCCAGAAISSTVFCATNPDACPEWSKIWMTWWMGDALGVFLFAPLIFAWSEKIPAFDAKRFIETVACFACLLVLTWLVFGSSLDVFGKNNPRVYIILPMIVWAGLRLGYRGVTTALVIVAVLSMASTMVSSGPFARTDLNDSLLSLGSYLCCLIVTGLSVAAVVDQKSAAESKLSEANATLESRVRQRTEELRELTGQLYTTIAEQSATLRALTASQARLEIATTASKIGYWEWNLQSGTIEISPLWLAHIGYSQEESLKLFSDKLWRERLHPDDAERARQAVADHLKAPETDYSIEFRLRHKDGSYRNIYSRGKCLLNGSGAPERMIGCHVDVTELRQAERSVSLMRKLVDQVNDCIEIVDPATGRFLDCNKRWCEEHGYTREEALKMSVLDVDPTHDDSKLVEVIKFVKSSPGVLFESVHRRKDGTEFPVEISARYVPGEKDYIIVALRNISARKRAEDILRNSEERLRLALHVAKMGTWDWNLVTNEVLTDANLRQLFTGNETIIPSNGSDFSQYIHSDDARRVKEAIRSAIEGDGHCHCTFRVVWEDKSVHWLEGLGTVHRDASNKAIRLVGVAADITERRNSEQRIKAFATLAYELNKAGTHEQAARLIADVAEKLFGWDAMVVVIFKESTGLNRAVYYADTINGSKQEVRSELDDREPSQRMKKTIKEGAELILRGVDQNDAQSLVPFGNKERLSKSLMFVPIRDGKTTVGMLSIQSYRVNAYKESDLETLQSLADECAAALARIELERKRALSEERLRACIETTPNVCVQWYDEQGRVVYWNQASEKVFGWTSAEAAGRTLDQLILDPGGGEKFSSILEDIKSTGQPAGLIEFEFTRKDASRGTCISTVFAIPSTDGRRHFVCMDVDITERKAAEAALRESRGQFADLVNNIDGIVWEAEIETLQMTFVSNQAERILGYPLNRWTESRTFWADHIHPDDRDHAVSYCSTHMRLGKSHDLEYRMIAADGRVVWMRDLVAVTSKEGKPFTLRGIMVDITKRKVAEQALKESAAHFKALFENAPDAVFLIGLEADERGKILSANRSAAKMHGYTVEELTSMTIFQLDVPDDIEKSESRIERLLKGESLTFEVRHFRKDGSIFPIEVTAELLVVGERKFILAFDRDITERKANETLLSSQKRILEMIASGADIYLTLDELCITIEEQCPGACCSIMLVDADGKRLRSFAGPHLPKDYFNSVDGVPVGPCVGSCGTAAYLGEPVFSPDILADPLWAHYQDTVRKFPLRSCWSTPITDANKRVIGAFGVYRNSVGRPTELEIRAVNAAKDTAAIALEKHAIDNQLARSREDLRRLSANLVEAQEAARRHLARELHDEIGQTLTATKLLLQSLKHHGGGVQRNGAVHENGNPSDTTLIHGAVQNVDQMLQIVRNLSLNLRPPMLDDFGLVSALRWLLDQHTRTTGLQAVLDSDYAVESPDARIETACFRITQEALTNITRHSGAKQVIVTLRSDARDITLQIADDGVGFDVQAAQQAARKGQSLGLLNLHERAALVGGKVEMISAPGNGTRINAVFPLASQYISVTT